MQENGYIHFNQAEGRDCLTLGGDWTVAHYIDLKKQLANLGDVPQSVTCNIESMKKLDTAGVQLLYRALGEHKLRQLPLTEQQHNLIDTVINACSNQEPPLPPKSNGFVKMLERIGIFSSNLYRNQRDLLGFMGATLQSAAQVIGRPSRWRVTAFVAQLEETGLNALPIVALLTFLVGAVVAFFRCNRAQRFRCQYIHHKSGRLFLFTRICCFTYRNYACRENSQCFYRSAWFNES